MPSGITVQMYAFYTLKTYLRTITSGEINGMARI